MPRYYDEQKEEMKKRKARIAKELQLENNTDNNERIPLIKGQIKNHYHQSSNTQRKQFNIRFLAILAVLLFLAYYLLLK